MDIGKLMGLKSKLEMLRNNHPKFVQFLEAVKQKSIKEGTIIEVTVTNEEGEKLESAIKLSASDMEAIKDIMSIKP